MAREHWTENVCKEIQGQGYKTRWRCKHSHAVQKKIYRGEVWNKTHRFNNFHLGQPAYNFNGYL